MGWTKTLSLAVATSLALLFCLPAALGQGDPEESAPKDSAEPTVATQAFLGLGVEPLHPALTAQLPEVTGKGRGVVVEHVMKESPAAKAGLKKHDILIHYDEQDLYSPEQLVKLVRNDQPGREVSLGYVRAGKLNEVKVRLGEVPARQPVRGTVARPVPLDPRPDSPANLQRREQMERRERARQNDPRPWAMFKSMTVTKLDDGRYKAEIDFRDKDEKLLHREYVGTRQEIRQAIQNDEALPEDEKKHLLRSLDQQTPVAGPFFWPGRLSDFFDFERERFNWPNLEF